MVRPCAVPDLGSPMLSFFLGRWLPEVRAGSLGASGTDSQLEPDCPACPAVAFAAPGGGELGDDQ